VTLFSAVKTEMEFTSGTWTDVTADVRMPISVKHGRATPYDDIGATELSFVMDNPVGDYTPDNVAGAHYPNVVKGVPVRVTVTKSGTDYRRFTGTVSRFHPSWPSSGDYQLGTVAVTAIDSLGLLAQKKLASNFTETVLWRGRASSVFADAWEAGESTAGLVTFLTNFSRDTTPGSASAAYSGDLPTLSFGDDKELSVGKVVTSNTGTDGRSCTTICGFQASPLQIVFHLKCPSDLLSSDLWNVGTFYNSSSAAVCNIVMTANGSENGLFLMNATMTTNLGIIANLPRGQWVKVTIWQNSGTATHLNVQAEPIGGGASALTNANLDVRNIRSMEIPGGAGKLGTASWGGIAALGTTTAIDLSSSIAAGTGLNFGQRVTSLGNMCDAMPITIASTGTVTQALLTGTLADRSAMDVLREVARSASGILWCRPRDGQVTAIGSDLVRPASSVATVSLLADCTGPPTLDDTSDTQPTRASVTWPGGTALYVDSTAEADGTQRSASLTTVCASVSDATSVGSTFVSRRSTGTRIRKLVIDLCSAVTDHTSALFSTASALEGLYPTARLTISDATPVFGTSTINVYVEGWIETYLGSGMATLELDTSS
jgi:hypothetical protein